MALRPVKLEPGAGKGTSAGDELGVKDSQPKKVSALKGFWENRGG